MVTFKSLEEFYKQRKIPQTFEDVLKKRKDKKFATLVKSQLMKYKLTLPLIPKSKLLKIIEAKYKKELLKGVEKKVGDVKTLRKLKKEREKSEKIVRLFETKMLTFEKELNALIKEYKTYKTKAEKQISVVKKRRQEYEKAVKSYNKLIDAYEMGKVKDTKGFMKTLSSAKKMVYYHKDRYLTAVELYRNYVRRMRNAERKYKMFLMKFKSFLVRF